MDRTAQRAKEETPRQKKPQACILFSTALPFQQTDIIQKWYPTRFHTREMGTLTTNIFWITTFKPRTGDLQNIIFIENEAFWLALNFGNS